MGALLGREDGTDEPHEGRPDREARAEYVRTYHLPCSISLIYASFLPCFLLPPLYI